MLCDVPLHTTRKENVFNIDFFYFDCNKKGRQNKTICLIDSGNVLRPFYCQYGRFGFHCKVKIYRKL
jgi:hypothetical protein